MSRRAIHRSLLAAAFVTATALTSLAPISMPPAAAADEAPKTKPVKAKSRTERSATVAAVTADSLQITTKKNGAVDIALTPQTEYWRQEENLKPDELKVGDTIVFALRSTDGQPTVTSLTPLTLKFGDEATLTLNKTDRMSFDRLTAIKSSDLATGQNVTVAMNVLPDGKNEARRVTVIVPKAKAH